MCTHLGSLGGRHNSRPEEEAGCHSSQVQAEEGNPTVAGEAAHSPGYSHLEEDKGCSHGSRWAEVAQQAVHNRSEAARQEQDREGVPRTSAGDSP